MKKLIIFLCFFAFSTSVMAQSWDWFPGIGDNPPTEEKPAEIGVQNNNIIGCVKDNVKTALVGADQIQIKKPAESKWNLDIDVTPYVFPDQKAPRQFDTGSFTIGATYKFSEHVHLWTKYVQLSIGGAKLDGQKTSYEHKHVLGGAGIRWYAGDSQQVQLNFGSGSSEVKEKESGIAIENLDTPVVAEAKYLWIEDNLSWGIGASIVDIPSTSGESASYEKGGYKMVFLTLQIGIDGALK